MGIVNDIIDRARDHVKNELDQLEVGEDEEYLIDETVIDLPADLFPEKPEADWYVKVLLDRPDLLNEHVRAGDLGEQIKSMLHIYVCNQLDGEMYEYARQIGLLEPLPSQKTGM